MSIDSVLRRCVRMGGGERWPGPGWRVGLAGMAMIGVTFGFARYGYGLFLPEFRAEFGLSVAQLGLIGSAACVGYVVGPLLVAALVGRIGPRPLIVFGGVCATAGTGTVALAQDAGVLTGGLILAGAGSGWVWAPYSDVVDRAVPAGRRERVMGAIATGTAFAVTVAGPVALLGRQGLWRYAWLGFAVVALLTTVANARVLPGGVHRTHAAGTAPGLPSPGGLFARSGPLLRPGAVALHVTAFFYGVAGAVYWNFAVETISARPELPGATVPLFWTLMGLAGTVGALTGRAIGRFGLRRAHVGVFTGIAAAALLLAAAPGTLPLVLLSAVLYGPAFMAGSALLAVWSYYVFPERPATGFTVAVFFLGLGTTAGPATLGVFADAYGLGPAFLLTAAVAAVPLLFRPRMGATTGRFGATNSARPAFEDEAAHSGGLGAAAPRCRTGQRP